MLGSPIAAVRRPRAGRAPSFAATIYYELTKPRMNFLVLVTTMVGYYMAVQVRADWGRVLHDVDRHRPDGRFSRRRASTR